MKFCAPILHNPVSPELPAPPPCTTPQTPGRLLQSTGLCPQACPLKLGIGIGGGQEERTGPPGAAVTLPGPWEERVGQAGLHCCSLTGRCSHHTLQLPTRRGHSIHH